MEFLKSLIIIFGISAIVVYALGRIKVPSLVGFLIAGVLLGPYGLQLIKDVHAMELLAEIGVILLMFTIGLEFSMKDLMSLRTQVFGAGLIQVVLTVAVVAALSLFLLDQGINAALFDGFLIALSSTAIVIKLLMQKGDISSPEGRASVGILIFQDLCVVPFVLLVPILAGGGGKLTTVLITMLKSFALLLTIFAAVKWVVPYVLHEVVKTRSRELFIITIIVLCIGTAFITSQLGLSLALGAFLAGIIISESEYASQAIADVMPFKESFIGLFFISVGMLMNTKFFLNNFITISIIVLTIILIKQLIVTCACLLIGTAPRPSMLAGFYLCQIGEFSFVLAVAGRKAGLLEDATYQAFLSASVITLLLTPFIMSFATKFVNFLPVNARFLMSRMAKENGEDIPEEKSNHVIIVGFGINGRNLAKVLSLSGIPYQILEMNPHTVKIMKKKGEPIYYGDATSIELLHKMGVDRARILVVTISDPAATRRIVQTARKENSTLRIIVRTRFVAETEDLLQLGANEVIPEEFETSIEIFSRVLHHCHIPRNVILDYIQKIREDNYCALRTVEISTKALSEKLEFLKSIETESYLITDNSNIKGQTIKSLDLRAKTGATIIAVQRGETIYQNPSTDYSLQSGDVLLLIGKRSDIQNAINYLDMLEYGLDNQDEVNAKCLLI